MAQFARKLIGPGACTRGGTCSSDSSRLHRAFRRLKKPRWREMSARSYALHSVCPQLFLILRRTGALFHCVRNWLYARAYCPHVIGQVEQYNGKQTEWSYESRIQKTEYLLSLCHKRHCKANNFRAGELNIRRLAFTTMHLENNTPSLCVYSNWIYCTEIELYEIIGP